MKNESFEPHWKPSWDWNQRLLGAPVYLSPFPAPSALSFRTTELQTKRTGLGLDIIWVAGEEGPEQIQKNHPEDPFPTVGRVYLSLKRAKSSKRSKAGVVPLSLPPKHSLWVTYSLLFLSCLIPSSPFGLKRDTKNSIFLFFYSLGEKICISKGVILKLRVAKMESSKHINA